ncbi:DUF4190 domain-containing protein [Streptomyces sp. ISL-11]|uniref:DUF4190 domain-containing protein n=1 Tax=Streptomyces sp. ISL-11 TaxID=2819174 RepID=UPI001BEC977D|nr:DUF4190 domain-containing protein [Streptomyces sp. ISL-11]MBT2383458.1 DUF4190 domain-containing protein [Streptomyces sp. ISL-11]
MSDKAAAEQPPQRDRDPWAPPERQVSLDKPGTAQVPGQRTADRPPVPAHPAQAPYAAPAVAAAPPASQVPPVPPAPTGPGTPSAYRGGPYGQGTYAQAAYAQGPYGAVPYGQAPYGGPVAYGPRAYEPGSYGYPASAPYGPGMPGAGPADENGLGIAALVLGIVGTVLSPSVVLGVVLGILAIVFGAIGRSKASGGRATNKGQALTGLILGGVALVLSVVMVFVYINVGDSTDDGPTPEDDPDATYGAYVSAPVLVVDRAASR